MKSFNHHRSILNRIALGITLAGIVLLANSVAAQEKGAQRLLKSTDSNSAQNLKAGDAAGMSCSKCKDSWVTTTQPAGKAVARTTQTPRHECPTCSTKIVTKGVGKQAQNLAIHSCQESSGANASCCAINTAAREKAVAENHKH